MAELDVLLYGKIVVIKRNGDDGSMFPFTMHSCILGSSESCSIRINISNVSPRQCKIFIKEDKRAALKNLSSDNPTKINGKEIIGTQNIQHMDIITVADRCFRFEYPVGSEFEVEDFNDQENIESTVNTNVKILTPTRKPPQSENQEVHVSTQKSRRSSVKRNSLPSSEFKILTPVLKPPRSADAKSPGPRRSANLRNSLADLKRRSVKIDEESLKSGDSTPASSANNTPVSSSNNTPAPRKSSDRKRTSADAGLDEPPRRSKRVSFGYNLSPELFDKTLPPGSPLRKGSMPRKSLQSSLLAQPAVVSKKSLLKRKSIPGGTLRRSPRGSPQKSPRKSAVSPASPRKSAVSPKSPRKSAVSPKSPRQSSPNNSGTYALQGGAAESFGKTPAANSPNKEVDSSTPRDASVEKTSSKKRSARHVVLKSPHEQHHEMSDHERRLDLEIKKSEGAALHRSPPYEFETPPTTPAQKKYFSAASPELPTPKSQTPVVSGSSRKASPAATKSVTPATKSVTPATKSVTPATKSVTPPTKSVTPPTKSVTPPTKSVTPATKSATPKSAGRNAASPALSTYESPASRTPTSRNATPAGSNAAGPAASRKASPASSTSKSATPASRNVSPARTSKTASPAASRNTSPGTPLVFRSFSSRSPEVNGPIGRKSSRASPAVKSSGKSSPAVGRSPTASNKSSPLIGRSPTASNKSSPLIGRSPASRRNSPKPDKSAVKIPKLATPRDRSSPLRKTPGSVKQAVVVDTSSRLARSVFTPRQGTIIHTDTPRPITPPEKNTSTDLAVTPPEEIKKAVALRAIHGKQATPKLTPNVRATLGGRTRKDTPAEKRRSGRLGSAAKPRSAKKTWADIVKKPKRKSVATVSKAEKAKAVMRKPVIGRRRVTTARKSVETIATRPKNALPSTGHVDSPETFVLTKTRRKSMTKPMEKRESVTSTVVDYDDVPATPEAPPTVMFVSPLTAEKKNYSRSRDSPLTKLKNSRKSVDLRGVREMMGKARTPASPKLTGVKVLLDRPKVQPSPQFVGVKEMMKEIEEQASPDLTGVRELMREAKSVRSPRLAGIRNMYIESPIRASPRLAGLKELMADPLSQRSPKYYGLKNMWIELKQMTSPDLTGLADLYPEAELRVSIPRGEVSPTQLKSIPKQGRVVKPVKNDTIETSTPGRDIPVAAVKPTVRRARKVTDTESDNPPTETQQVEPEIDTASTRRERHATTTQPDPLQKVSPPQRGRKAAKVTESAAEVVANSEQHEDSEVVPRRGRRAAAAQPEEIAVKTPARRARKPKADKIEAETTVEVVTTRRGRKAQPVVAPEVESEPTQRGRKPAAVKQTIEPNPVVESVEVTVKKKPTRSGRKEAEPTAPVSTEKLAEPTAPVSTEKHATRGRRKVVHAEEQATVEEPLTRGRRKAGVVAEKPVKELKKATRGRAAAAEKPETVPPMKRGRRAAAIEIDEPKEATPTPKRGKRPAKSAVSELVVVEKPARRGRKAAEPVSVEEPAPMPTPRRGRSAAVAESVETPVETKQPVKRGRKVVASAVPEVVEQPTERGEKVAVPEVVARAVRGGKRRAAVVQEEQQEVPAKRGRKKVEEKVETVVKKPTRGKPQEKEEPVKAASPAVRRTRRRV